MVAMHLGMVASACLILGYKMEEEPRWIWDIINLLHMLGVLSHEGGGMIGVKEEEEDNNSAMTNDKPKFGAAGNNGRHG